MRSVSQHFPKTRRGKAIVAASVVVVAAVLGGVLAQVGGIAWVGALSAATVTMVLLLATRAEASARRIAREAKSDGISKPLAKRLGTMSRRTIQLQQTVDQQSMQLEYITELLQGLGSHTSTHDDVTMAFAQMQAFVQLNSRIDDPPIVPAMRGWAASPDVVLHLVTLLIRDHPAVVLECGSGVSTTWLAAVARQHSPNTRIIALEHDASFAEQTRRSLRENGLLDWAEVRDAPLEEFGGPGGPLWYSVSALEGIEDVSLVFVDGPPETTGPLARMPALEALSPALIDDAVIVLDDTIRRGEQATVTAWLESRPDMIEQTLQFEKGAVELRFRQSEDAAHNGGTEA